MWPNIVHGRTRHMWLDMVHGRIQHMQPNMVLGRTRHIWSDMEHGQTRHMWSNMENGQTQHMWPNMAHMARHDTCDPTWYTWSDIAHMPNMAHMIEHGTSDLTWLSMTYVNRHGTWLDTTHVTCKAHDRTRNMWHNIVHEQTQHIWPNMAHMVGHYPYGWARGARSEITYMVGHNIYSQLGYKHIDIQLSGSSWIRSPTNTRHRVPIQWITNLSKGRAQKAPFVSK